MSINWMDVREEAATYLSQLLRINTSNPLKNEMDAIRFLVEIAESNGLYTYVQKTDENRGNVIISLTQEYSEPIVLLSHLDVVPAKEEDWDVPPFSGKIVDDVLWGRGTIDTKQLTITQLMVLLLLKRNEIHLDRDVILIATSDEENGSKFGLLPFLQEHGDLFKNSLVFNEGGGFPLLIGDHNYYLCEMGQKGLAKVKITAMEEIPSNPYLPNNSAIKTILLAIRAFQDSNINEKMPTSSFELFSKISSDLGVPFSEHEFDQFLNIVPTQYVSLFKAMSKTTFSITKWEGGRKHSTVNGHYDIFLDSRPIPSLDLKAFEKLLQNVLGSLPVEYEILSFSQGYESTMNKKQLAIFQRELEKEVPNGIVVPFLSIGGSDSRHLLSYQAQVYGYCPMLPDMSFDKVIKMVHGVNERIPLESLRFGIQNIYEIIVRLGGRVLYESS